MDQPISPKKFATLPEDIQSRIIRSGIGQSLSRQHHKLILADRIKDAGTKPFSKSELEWLSEVRRLLLFFAEHDGSLVATIYLILIGGQSLIGTDSYAVSYNKTNSTIIYEESEPLDFTGIELEQYLTGRFDSQILVPSLIEIFVPAENRTYKPNLILTDLKSVFLILFRRFSVVISNHENIEEDKKNNIIRLARTWTQKYLNNVVDDHQGYKLPALLAYLLLNSAMFDLDYNVENYLSGSKIMTPEYVEELEHICSQLYQRLSRIIQSFTY